MPVGESHGTPVAVCNNNNAQVQRNSGTVALSDTILHVLVFSHIHRLPAIDTATATEIATMLEVGVVRVAGDVAVSDLLVKSKLKPRSVLLGARPQ